MRWWVPAFKAAAIFSYFIVFPVWLPSRLLRIDAVASADPAAADAVGVLSWLVAMTVGIVVLRVAQRRRWI